MAPFRSSRRSQAFGENAPNRTRTGQVEHDIFEGYPARRWVRQAVVVSQTPKGEQPDDRLGGPQAQPELPMPRDSHLLTPMSRALLRAARAGCKYIRPAPAEVEDDEKEIKDIDEAVATPSYERTFTAKKWTLLPRHMEPPHVEFLAERRVGLPSLYGSAAVNGTAEAQPVNKTPMRKTKFKRVDAATGNVSVYEAWVPEGHKLEGEITEENGVVAENAEATVVAASPAPGTVVEGVGVVDKEGVVVAGADSTMVAPIKKKYPPPKRKAKGVGKGRRKKVMFAPGEGEVAPTTPGVPGASEATDVTMSGTAQSESVSGTPGPQEEYEDEDEENEGEESDEGEESAPESKSPGATIISEQHADNTSTAPEKTESKPEIQEPLPSLPEQEQQQTVPKPSRDLSSSPDLPLAAASANANRTTMPHGEETSSTTELQPPPTVPIESLSSTSVPPVTDTALPEDNDSTVKCQDEQLSEAPVKEERAAELPLETFHDQNGSSAPQEKAPSPANGSNPTPIQPEEQLQPSPPKEEAPTSTPAAPEAHNTNVQFDEDGEVDLLGSLEASLDNPEKPKARHQQASPSEKDQNATDVLKPGIATDEKRENNDSAADEK